MSVARPSDAVLPFDKVLSAAGLPTDRKSKFHRMRRSVASHLHAAGHNATDALGHSSADVTRKSYFDPNIIGAVRPSALLFRPGQPNREPSGIVLDPTRKTIRPIPRAKVLPIGKAVANG